ncbi:MAG TPA: M28 family peptidase [Chthoniobacterales bacterium]|nr:M28 family peptidase [Chthoniobacterales bacterium]
MIRSLRSRKLLGSVARIAAALIVIAAVVWFFGIRMPGRNPTSAAALNEAEVALRGELVRDVQKLAGEIGERNLPRYAELEAAAQFIEASFTQMGLPARRYSYEIGGRACHNLEVEIPGARPEIVLIGAHYDSVFGSPGANDNASGVAALLALARRFAGKTSGQTLRFVAFANEEPPYFQSEQMGSLVYAKACKARGDRISAMISLETIGYFSDAAGSQVYPAPGLGLFYPTTGNFIGFVGNVPSRGLVRKVIKMFRETGKLPAQGAALPAVIPGIGWSDQWSFWQCGYPAIMVTDTAPFRYPHYHSRADTPDKLDYDRFALVVSGMQSVIEQLAK